MNCNEIYSQMTEEPAAVRAAFVSLFARDIMRIAECMEAAHAIFAEIDRHSKQSERSAHVASLLFLSMSALASSVQMFISGYLPSGGNQLRLAVESCSVGLLCSNARAGTYQSWIRQQYSADKAPAHVRRLANELNVDVAMCEQLVKVQKFYNKHSHAGIVAIGATMNFENLGLSSLVGNFDRSKVEDFYIPEIVNRRGVAGCLAPIFIAAKSNLAGAE